MENEALEKKLPLRCLQVGPVGDDMLSWKATVQGPPQSVYEGGVFQLGITFPRDYPLKPPTVSFLTAIHHPNITAEGQICLDVLKNWNPSINVAQILGAVSSLLAAPDDNSSLDHEIGRQMRDDRSAFEQVAREKTKKYAVPNSAPEHADTGENHQ